RLLRRRQEDESEVIRTLEMSALFFELSATFGVDEGRHRVREIAQRIVLRRVAAGLDEDRPAGAEAAERIVEARGRSGELCGGRAVEVRPTEACGTLQAAVLVEDHAYSDERSPGQEIGEALRFL